MTKTGLLVIISVFLVSCNGIKKGNKLSKSDIKYIEKLGLINEGEEIILFSSQGGNKISGNFISNERLASYWIERNEENNQINFARYREIDTLITKNLSNSLTYASFIKVIKKDGTSFKVYVDDDSSEKIEYFFQKAISEWKNSK